MPPRGFSHLLGLYYKHAAPDGAGAGEAAAGFAALLRNLLTNSDMKSSTQTPTSARPARGAPSRSARQRHQPSTHPPSTIPAVENRLRLRDDFFCNQISPRELLQPFDH